jgi:predicted amidohydrolase
MSFVRFGSLYLDCKLNKVEENIQLIMNFLQQAVDQGCTFIITPEYGISGYYDYRIEHLLSNITIDENSNEAIAISEFAKKNKVYILFNSQEYKQDLLMYITLVYDPEGQLILKYYKTNYKLENYGLDQINHITTPYGNIVIRTCFELQFRQFWKLPSDFDIHCIIVSLLSNIEWHIVFGSLRALEYNAWVICSNRPAIIEYEDDNIDNMYDSTTAIFNPVGRIVFEQNSLTDTIFTIDIPLDDNGIIDKTRVLTNDME